MKRTTRRVEPTEIGMRLYEHGRNIHNEMLAARETITVPAGTFQDAIKVEARMNMKIHLSESRRTVSGIDVMTAWFAKGVGLVKYTERQELSAVKEDRGVVTEIMEELEEYEIKPAKGH